MLSVEQQQRVNHDPKRTMKALYSGDPDLCSRAYTHDEAARWLLTTKKLSKNRIGDYLGRSEDDAVRTLAAFLQPLDFAPDVITYTAATVSYTHLTQPKKREVKNSLIDE